MYVHESNEARNWNQNHTHRDDHEIREDEGYIWEVQKLPKDS
jgi:hypothetical protein